MHTRLAKVAFETSNRYRWGTSRCSRVLYIGLDRKNWGLFL